MLHILICENDTKQRDRIETTVRNHITTKGGDIELVLSTGRPTEVLDYLGKHPSSKRLYFLDIDLQHKINGINLAARIREIDASAKIVFITTHTELSYLVFVHKIEAMDYIIKDAPEDIEKRIIECISLAYKRCLDEGPSTQEREYFTVKAGGQVWNFLFDEIMFFETHLTMKHKIILHAKDGQVEFRAPISSVVKINSDFFRCHKSFVVNIKNIKQIDKIRCEIRMINGEAVPITAKKMTELSKAMENLSFLYG